MKPLQVLEYDHPLRKLVRSEDDPDSTYLVDLSDPQFPSGRCNCRDFDIRIEPHVKRGEQPPCQRLYCKHILAVVKWMNAEKKKLNSKGVRSSARGTAKQARLHSAKRARDH